VTQQPGSWPAAAPAPPAVRPPRAGESWTPERVEAVPGTEFGLVQLKVAPITSGLAVGSLLAGIASILVSTLVLCFGVAGSADGWGGVVAGAFALLGVLVGGGGAGLGLLARRQIRRSGQAGRVRFTGRGLAVAGLSCGAAGLGISVLTFLLVLALQSS
jgi:hypothetical protein